MWTPRRILVGTDLSPAAEGAAAVAFGLARRTGAELHLLHALSPGPQPLTGYDVVDELLLARGDPARQRQRAERALGRLAERAPDLDVTLHVLDGPPGAAILSRRISLEADLLVLGARGLRGVRRFLLGSVADRALRRPGCPLLLVHQPPDGGEFKKLLVGIELPDVPPPQLAVAAALAHHERSEAVLLHVMPPKGYVSDARHVELDPRSVPDRLERMLAGEDRTIPAQVTVRRGDPVALIPRVARSVGADLVALGAERNPDGWPGRVADRVARAGLPALLYVWPEPESDEDLEG